MRRDDLIGNPGDLSPAEEAEAAEARRAKRYGSNLTIIRCSACGDSGWVLDCDPTKDPACLELLPCLLPDCARSGRPLALVSLNGAGLEVVARHPMTGEVMSVAARAVVQLRPPEPVPLSEAASKVISLMDALEQSVARAKETRDRER